MSDDPRLKAHQVVGVVKSIGAGPNVNVDDTDPEHPVVSATVPTALVPLTTVIGGVPDLVWDADNQLVYTEAP